jgi:hypothetical protein
LEGQDRPHMFINELNLNVEYLKEQILELKKEDAKQVKDALDFAKQLLTGIEYYRSISDEIYNSVQFNSQLSTFESEIIDLVSLISAQFKAK